MPSPLRVLLVADPTFDVGPLAYALGRGGFEPNWTRVGAERALREKLLGSSWQIILSTFNLRQLGLSRALEVAKELSPDTPFIVISAPISEAAVDAMHAGAADYVTEDNLLRLPAAVARELQQAAARRARRSAEQRFRGLIENVPVGIVVHRERRILYPRRSCGLEQRAPRIRARLVAQHRRRVSSGSGVPEGQESSSGAATALTGSRQSERRYSVRRKSAATWSAEALPSAPLGGSGGKLSTA
jgi:PAS domain-containing protein